MIQFENFNCLIWDLMISREIYGKTLFSCRYSVALWPETFWRFSSSNTL